MIFTALSEVRAALPVTDPTDTTWTFCATENSTCEFDGKRLIRYGANSTWSYLEATNKIKCSHLEFGDPLLGVAKRCEHGKATPVADAIDWQPCAKENEFCKFDGNKQVRYGANSKWTYLTAQNGVKCSFNAFGDPLLGIEKRCEYGNPKIERDVEEWKFCASENSTCEFDGKKLIRYGANSTWAYLEATSQIKCSHVEFGDPLLGVRKRCEYRKAIDQAIRTSTNTAPTLTLDVYVIDDGSGRNKARWSREFLEKVLDQANALTKNRINFKISKFEIIVNTALYNLENQGAILAQLIAPQSQTGKVTLGISGPTTSDTAGQAFQNSFIEDLKPKMVIRSRKNDSSKEDTIEIAKIFLHELGHTVGFAHDGKQDSFPFNTDDWWYVQDAVAAVEVLAKWSQMHLDENKQSVLGKFSCKVGGYEPDTNVMFPMNTAAVDLNACAMRCLTLSNCVAIAQATWKDARCILFSTGAKIIKNRSYNNTNTCWRIN